MLCQQHWWLVLSFFSHYFRFWGFPSKSPQLTFPFWEVLGVDFQFPFSKALRCYFSDPPFGLLHLLSFSLNGQILLYQAERSLATFLHGPLSCIPRGTRLFLLECWFLSHQPFSKPWVADGTHPPSFFASMSILPWAVLIPIDFFLHISGIPSFWESQVSWFSPFLGWAELLFFPFSLFSKAQSLPIHGFGPSLTYLKWTLIDVFGPCPFFKGPNGFFFLNL